MFAVALVAACIALLAILRFTMLGGVDTALELRAEDIESLLEAGAAPDSVAIDDDDEGLAQIVRGGVVLAASENIEGEPPIDIRSPGEPYASDELPVAGEFLVLVDEFEINGVPVTLVVATSLEDINQTTRIVALALLVGGPLLLALVATIVWRVVGRALRPVERISSDVEAISGQALTKRVSVPASDDEIRHLASTMNSMLTRLEESAERQGRFVSDASHELRTPIAIIRHELDVATAHPEFADWPEVAAVVLEEDLRMQRLVDDLLWLAQADGGVRPDRNDLLDLDDLVGRVLSLNHHDSSIDFDLSGISAGQVRGNADELGRIITILTNNAVRHANSVVVIAVESIDGTVRLHVDDDGEGVPTGSEAKIFERFGRADESRARAHGGAGLGLAIATEIAHAHDATLTLSESPFGGARFTLTMNDARTTASSGPNMHNHG